MNATARKIETASAILPRDALRPALALAKKIVERRNTIPVLSNILLRSNSDGGAEIVATDLDIELSIRINGALADKSFAVTLPAHTFQDVEKKARATEAVTVYAPVIPAPPVAEFSQNEAERAAYKEAMAITSEAGGQPACLDFEGLRLTLQHLPAYDFPMMQWEGETHADFDMPTAEFLGLIDATAFAISTEETRYYLNGIYLHTQATPGGNGCPQLMAVATDGHRLAKRVIDCPQAGAFSGVIVPRKTVLLLQTLCRAKGAAESIRVKINTTKMLFTLGNITVMSKLIDGVFPDYNRVMPSNNKNVARFDRLAMAEGIKAVSCISSERGRAVKFTFDPAKNHAVLTVNNPDAGSAQINVPCEFTFDSPGFDIGFNALYMLEILATCEGDMAALHLADSGSPTLVTGGNEADSFVLMPMRV